MSFLLKEDGGFLLLETGDKLILEPADGFVPDDTGTHTGGRPKARAFPQDPATPLPPLEHFAFATATLGFTARAVSRVSFREADDEADLARLLDL